MATGLRRWAALRSALTSLGQVTDALKALENVLGRTPVYSAHKIVTATYTVLDSDGLILVDTTSGAVTVNFPDALLNLDRTWTVKHYAGGNAITADAFSGQLIYATGAGATTLVWNSIGTAYTFQAIGTAPNVGALAVI